MPLLPTIVFFIGASSICQSDEPKCRPIARWALENPAQEIKEGGHEGTVQDVDVSREGTVAASTFDGRSSRIKITPMPSVNMGTRDFTISAWVHASGDEDMAGDILAKFDAGTRKGFSLSIVTRQGVTHSQANVRQLQFSIDGGSTPSWTDHGRPGNAVYVHALAVHGGTLYAGTCEPAKGQSGHVYRFEGDDRWIDCGSPDNSNAVISLAVFQGRLYAGTGKYRTGGSALPESENVHHGGRIFRHDGGTRWQLVGELPGVEAVGGLVVFQSRLYASSLYKPAGLFRWDESNKWTPCLLPDGGKRVESMISYQGKLYATSYDNGHVYEFDGRDWSDTGALGDNSQCYGFAIHHGHLFCSTWPSGRVYRLGSESGWRDVGRLGEELEVMGMAVYNGKLYAGTLPLAEVHRFDGDGQWTSVGRLDETPDVKYHRAWTMAVHQGRLFVGTLPSGRVHSMQTGGCVTYDREFPAGWRHVAAERAGDRLKLFLDGKLAAESDPFDARLDITNSAPVEIGFGPHDSFHGKLRDVRIYDIALSPRDIEAIAARSSK